MPGYTSDTASTSRVKVECYWYGIPEEVQPAWEVAGWVEMTRMSLGIQGPFSTLRRVVVVSPDHQLSPADFKLFNPKQSLYYPGTAEIFIHGQMADWGTFAHEFGHHLQYFSGALSVNSHMSDYGQRIQDVYKAVRGPSIVATDPGWFVEQWPEDFKACFGPGGVGVPEAPSLKQLFKLAATKTYTTV